MIEGASELVLLWLFAFFAGFIDSVVGGGGLIQLPALFILRPDLAAATVLGTNKLASIAGTGVALSQYMARVRIDPKGVLPAAVMALIFSFIGARTVTYLAPDFLRPMILVLLIAVAVYTVARKDFGSIHAPRLDPRRQLFAGLATGTAIGFYDGFFGPGTGSFLIFVFIGVFGFDFLYSSACAKVVNFATNLSAIAWFAYAGQIAYAAALPMGAFNIAGSLFGARLAILKGSSFVRTLFIVVVSLMIARFGYDILMPAGK